VLGWVDEGGVDVAGCVVGGEDGAGAAEVEFGFCGHGFWWSGMLDRYIVIFELIS
jgi:hypothetical protein